MEANNQSKNKKYESGWNQLLVFFNNSIVQIIVAIAITAAFFYFVERKEIEHRYSVSPIELIAEQLDDSPNFKILWDDEEIQNIKSVKIAFWNAGKQYISKDNISETNPLGISIPSGAKILYAEFIKTSRSDLDLNTSYNPSNIAPQFIEIEIIGDEAIEKNDGGVIKILFTGDTKDDFALTGRIFGSQNGFKEMGWQVSDDKKTASFAIYGTLMMAVFWGFSGIKFIFMKINEQTNPRKKYTHIMFLVLVIGMTIFGSILVSSELAPSGASILRHQT